MFESGNFTLHSGQHSRFKIECDSLTGDDWQTIADLIASRLVFRTVEGVPRGGLKLGAKLHPYQSQEMRDPLLIVDDVLTTGASMEAQRAGRDAIGIVLFNRGVTPPWVSSIFIMGGNFLHEPTEGSMQWWRLRSGGCAHE